MFEGKPMNISDVQNLGEKLALTVLASTTAGLAGHCGALLTHFGGQISLPWELLSPENWSIWEV